MGGFAGGGFFGSGGKSQSAVTTTTAQTGQSYADRSSTSLSGLQLQKGSSLTLTDQGAIDKAFNFLTDLTGAALQQTSDAQASAVGAFEKAQGLAGAINADQLAKWGLAALVVLVVGVAYLGSNK